MKSLKLLSVFPQGHLTELVFKGASTSDRSCPWKENLFSPHFQQCCCHEMHGKSQRLHEYHLWSLQWFDLTYFLKCSNFLRFQVEASVFPLGLRRLVFAGRGRSRIAS